MSRLRAKKGAVGMVLMASAFFILLILPLMKATIDYNLQVVRHQLCSSILEASMPAAYKAVSSEQLSLGKLVLNQTQANSLIKQHIKQNMSGVNLNAQLKSLTVKYSTNKYAEAENHWLSRNRPQNMPVVTATAVWVFTDGWQCQIKESIELILD
ncbi:MAG: hypothetical protein GX749_07710 [Ruminococcaceae bacterium]|nr:hypothetical protein [Oscillospiraceae bacterium]